MSSPGGEVKQHRTPKLNNMRLSDYGLFVTKAKPRPTSSAKRTANPAARSRPDKKKRSRNEKRGDTAARPPATATHDL